MTLPRGAKRAAIILATALLAVTASPAAATSSTITIGPGDVAPAGTPLTTQGTVINSLAQSPSPGRITSWQANFACEGLCGQARLLVLRPTGDSSVYDIVATSDWEDIDGDGVSWFPTQLAVQGADTLGVETDGPAVLYHGASSTLIRTAGAVPGGATQLTTTWNQSGEEALFSAELEPQADTTTTVTATPNPVQLGATVGYSVHVEQALAGSCFGGCGDPPDITGTVSLTADGNPIAGCQSLTVTNGAASCSAAAASPRGNHGIEATYSGDASYAASEGDTNLRVLAPTTVDPVATPNPVARRGAITYTATIYPTPYLVSSHDPGQSQMAGFGTVAFTVDGAPVAGCGAVQVTQQAVATCVTTAPAVGGTHALDVGYSGSYYNTAATGHTTFQVLAPAVTVPDTDFGGVTAGTAGARTVTVTNRDEQAVSLGAAALGGSGAFTLGADGCADVTLAPGASCDVQLRFSPASAGAYAGTLSIADNAGATHTAALTGTGVAVPAPPATPVPPKQGGVFAPGAKPTLTVTTSAPSGGSGGGTPTAKVAVPLSCPADETCDLNGQITISTSSLAHASAVATTTVARFSKVHIAAGKVKTIKLKLSPAFIKRAQRQGIRRIKATLTINTVFGSGQTVTTHQKVVVLLPKAAKKKAAARPRFTG